MQQGEVRIGFGNGSIKNQIHRVSQCIIRAIRLTYNVVYRILSMGNASNLVFKRSFELFEIAILSSRYGFNRNDLSILDLSETENPLAFELERKGFRVQRIHHQQPIQEPLDLIVCFGPIKDGTHLQELLRTLEPTYQLVLMDVPNVPSKGSTTSILNPADYGKFRRYPIHRWYDFLFGWNAFRHLRSCPMVKIRPIKVDFRLRT